MGVNVPVGPGRCDPFVCNLVEWQSERSVQLVGQMRLTTAGMGQRIDVYQGGVNIPFRMLLPQIISGVEDEDRAGWVDKHCVRRTSYRKDCGTPNTEG